MFTLHIHTVDDPIPLFTVVSSATATSRVRNPSSDGDNLNPKELRGIAHLFRHLTPSSSLASSNASITTTPTTSISNPNARTTLLFVVAVPDYLSPDDFLLFCGSHIDQFSELLFLRNDGIEDRYSVLIELPNQLTADGFYCNFNGKRFKPSEAEVCHIYFVQSVEYDAEAASTPPPGFTELPTCPVCLERLDQEASGILSTLCDHSFHCSCISKWTHLSCQVCRLCQQHDDKPNCAVCGTLANLWICVICGFIGCGRYEKGHAIRHWSDTQHRYSLELEKQQVWDYVGDKYVHRLNQSKADGKSVARNSRCISLDGECHNCGYDDDSTYDGDLYESKVEEKLDEYNRLLATHMEVQRQHYESLLTEAKGEMETSISKAVEKAVFSRMQDMQYKWEECNERKKIVSDKIQNLTKNQRELQKKFKEVEQRESLSLKSMDDKIHDLEEQIRDIKIYVEAQRTLCNMEDSDGIKGGKILPIQQSSQTSSTNSRRRAKSGRRRN